MRYLSPWYVSMTLLNQISNKIDTPKCVWWEYVLVKFIGKIQFSEKSRKPFLFVPESSLSGSLVSYSAVLSDGLDNHSLSE